MEPSINISVGKPCSEKFSDFKSTKSGGFCSSCKKEVIDFRNMSDKQLIEFFKNRKNENTCGYFNDSQLRSYPIPRQSDKFNRFKHLRVVGFAFLSMISLYTVQAQNQKYTFEVVEQSNNPKRKEVKSVVIQDPLLTGTISDGNQPLPGANIVLKNTEIGTSTNFDGEFEFPKPLKEGDVLVVSYLGFKTQNIVIKNNQSPLNINLQEDATLCMLGEVEVNEVYKTKRTLWQKIKGIF